MLGGDINFFLHILLFLFFMVLAVFLIYLPTYGLCFAASWRKDTESWFWRSSGEHNFLKAVVAAYFAVFLFWAVLFGVGFSYVSAPDEGGAVIHTSNRFGYKGRYQNADFMGGTFSVFGTSVGEYHKTDIDSHTIFWRIKPERIEDFFRVAMDLGEKTSSDDFWQPYLREASFACENSYACVLEKLREVNTANFAEVMHVEQSQQGKK